jgi:hypothetical protein
MGGVRVVIGGPAVGTRDVELLGECPLAKDLLPCHGIKITPMRIYHLFEHPVLTGRTQIYASLLSTNSMPESLDKVLLPMDVSDSVSLGERITEALQSSDAVLLGYWPIPEQTSPDQAREQFGEEADRRLQSVADQLTTHGIAVQSRVAFTKDRGQLIDSAANEYGCQSVLLPGKEPVSSGPNRAIVLVKPDADLNRLVTTLGALFVESDVELFLFHAAGTKNEHLYDATEFMLRGLADRLGELGIDAERIEWEQSTGGDRLDRILSRVPDFDFVVLGESNPTIRERIFGTMQARIAEEIETPQLTIRTGV